MASVKAPLTLYSARHCPWVSFPATVSIITITANLIIQAHRATLALQETGIQHKIYEIDLQNKPVWYKDKINPASKVPVLQIGGDDENTPGVPRIPESGVLLELISDIAEERGGRSLTPADPVERGEPANLEHQASAVVVEQSYVSSSTLLYRAVQSGRVSQRQCNAIL